VFAFSEWLILMVLAACIALVVWLVVRANSGSGAPRVSQARVRGSAEDVLRDLQLATAGISGTVTRRETPDSLTVEWTSIPGWAVVIAVLAFPLGLIALVARTSTVGTVVVGQESEQVARLQIAGVYKKATASAINAVIESRS
jgi:uncharacterized membrane protein